MKEYLLLFRGGEPGSMDPQNSPEVFQKHMMKWQTWMQSLGEQGKFISGQPLTSEGQVIHGSKIQITDGPFMEGKEIVGGYLMIKAADLKEATELSKGCPILEMEGTVEVRPIQELGM